MEPELSPKLSPVGVANTYADLKVSNPGGKKLLHTQGRWFTDEFGRILQLRGVNLSGNAKLPYRPYLPTHISNREVFFDHKNVSFVGRPFPLDQADSHFARLRRWGFTFLRFCVTWEAIEHEGP